MYENGTGDRACVPAARLLNWNASVTKPCIDRGEAVVVEAAVLVAADDLELCLSPNFGVAGEQLLEVEVLQAALRLARYAVELSAERAGARNVRLAHRVRVVGAEGRLRRQAVEEEQRPRDVAEDAILGSES